MGEDLRTSDRRDAWWNVVFTTLVVLVAAVTVLIVVDELVDLIRYWFDDRPAMPPDPLSILLAIGGGTVIARFLSLQTTWGVRLQATVFGSQAAAERERRLRHDLARRRRRERARRS